MNDVTTTYSKSPMEELQAAVLTPEHKSQLLLTLPAHVSPDRFERNLYLTLTQVKDIDRCKPEDIFNEVMKIASLGLYLDRQLGEAYLIVGSGYKIQARVGYRGLVKLARQSGEITEFYAHEPYANEHANGLFRVQLGDDKRLEHEPMVTGDRGEWIGAYAVVKFANGEKDFEWMPKSDIFKIRDRSDAYKAFKAGSIKSTPWDSDEIEMGKKTVIRRLSKRLPQSPELAAALDLEDRAEGYLANAEDPTSRPTLSSRFAKPASGDGFNARGVAQQIESNSQAPMATSKQAEPIPSSTTGSSSSSTVDGDAGREASPRSPGPRLPAEVFTEYAEALGRFTSQESLDKGSARFWADRANPAKDSPDDKLLDAIYMAHRARVEGGDPEATRKAVVALIEEATKL